MRRLTLTALVSALLTLSGISLAQAQAQFVEQSRSTFHVRACPGPEAPGTARCHAHVVTDPKGNIITNATPSGYGPAQLQGAYNVSGASVSHPVVVAIVDAYGYPSAESDLGVYRSQFGLPACTTANGCFRKVNQNGGSSFPKSNTGWDQEQALDLDMVSAICPQCKILLVEANSATLTNLAAAEVTAASYNFNNTGLYAHSIGNSYGASESQAQGYDSAYNHLGIAVTASSGDSGYSAGPQFPATSEFVTAVGGTSLYLSGTTRTGEVVWSGAGSGCSTIYPKPTAPAITSSWQSSISCSMRMEADVSAVADPNTGVAVYGPVTARFRGWMVFGGTSASAQIISAMYGLNGSTVTYGSDPYNHTGSLNAVTSGSNGSCGTYLCDAGHYLSSPPYYSGPAGLGTPNGSGAF